jgi:hypothetical protein
MFCLANSHYDCLDPKTISEIHKVKFGLMNPSYNRGDLIATLFNLITAGYHLELRVGSKYGKSGHCGYI